MAWQEMRTFLETEELDHSIADFSDEKLNIERSYQNAAREIGLEALIAQALESNLAGALEAILMTFAKENPIRWLRDTEAQALVIKLIEIGTAHDFDNVMIWAHRLPRPLYRELISAMLEKAEPPHFYAVTCLRDYGRIMSKEQIRKAIRLIIQSNDAATLISALWQEQEWREFEKVHILPEEKDKLVSRLIQTFEAQWIYNTLVHLTEPRKRDELLAEHRDALAEALADLGAWDYAGYVLDKGSDIPLSEEVRRYLVQTAHSPAIAAAKNFRDEFCKPYIYPVTSGVGVDKDSVDFIRAYMPMPWHPGYEKKFPSTYQGFSVRYVWNFKGWL